MIEVWATFPEHPSYEVSSLGRIVNKNTGYERAESLSTNGYRRVNMYEKGLTKTYYVHQLVAELFLPEYRSGMIIGFHDGNPKNCAVDNLIAKQTIKEIRLAQPTRPSVVAARVRIRELGMIFRTAQDAADYIGGDPRNIYRCLRHERGKHMGYTFERVSVEEALRYHRGEHEN